MGRKAAKVNHANRVYLDRINRAVDNGPLPHRLGSGLRYYLFRSKFIGDYIVPITFGLLVYFAGLNGYIQQPEIDTIVIAILTTLVSRLVIQELKALVMRNILDPINSLGTDASGSAWPLLQTVTANRIESFREELKNLKLTPERVTLNDEYDLLFNCASGRYNAITANKPSDFYKTFSGYLSRHRNYVSLKKTKPGVRIIVGDKSAIQADDKWVAFKDWHQQTGVALKWISTQVAQNQTDGHDLSTYEIGIWSGYYAVFFEEEIRKNSEKSQVLRIGPCGQKNYIKAALAFEACLEVAETLVPGRDPAKGTNKVLLASIAIVILVGLILLLRSATFSWSPIHQRITPTITPVASLTPLSMNVTSVHQSITPTVTRMASLTPVSTNVTPVHRPVAPTFARVVTVVPSTPTHAVFASCSIRNGKLIAMGNFTLGIAANKLNGFITWPKAIRAGVQYGIVQATEGETLRDDQFINNWADMSQAGIIRGAYHILRPYYKGNTAEGEAQYYISVVRNLRASDFPPILSIQASAVQGIPPAKWVPYAKSWMIIVEKHYHRVPILDLDPRIKDKPHILAIYPMWTNIRSGIARPWALNQCDIGTVSGIRYAKTQVLESLLNK